MPEFNLQPFPLLSKASFARAKAKADFPFKLLHRFPECRRKDAETFAALWPDRPNPDRRPRAAEMDLVLHSERLNGRLKRKHPMSIDDLPDGAMIEFDGFAWAIRGKSLLRWTPAGYRERRRRPDGIEVSVLTPPSIVEVLAAGYGPQWHPSGESGRVLEPKDRDFPRGR